VFHRFRKWILNQCFNAESGNLLPLFFLRQNTCLCKTPRGKCEYDRVQGRLLRNCADQLLMADVYTVEFTKLNSRIFQPEVGGSGNDIHGHDLYGDGKNI